MKHIPSAQGAQAEPLRAKAEKHSSSGIRKGTEPAMLFRLCTRLFQVLPHNPPEIKDNFTYDLYRRQAGLLF